MSDDRATSARQASRRSARRTVASDSGVEMRRRLVEHHDVGRLEHEAGQGDPLLLAPDNR